ncbi:hypothetical protein [Streptomyces sp. NPDC045714]|uniref:restriction endonuclease subunit S n=1 Tax=Streptomyces sp. NPDC045714 TaxID=3154913 RepID=UPI0033C12FAC
MSAVIRVTASHVLERWDVKHVLARTWHRPPQELRPIGDVAVRRSESNPGGLRLGSIHFDGSMSLRPADAALKGRSFAAHSGDVVFSKIDVRNGAIGVVPEEHGSLAFSAEYPIYDVRSSGYLLPEYMRLLCRTEVFRSQVEALVVGHSGRKRVAPELFETLTIPVPSLVEQERIVLAEQEALKRIADARTASQSAPAEGIQEITRLLGLSATEAAPIRFPFVVDSARLGAWAVPAAAHTARGVSTELTSDYPVRPLGELAAVSYGLQKSPANRPGPNARPYLRVANVQDGYFDLTEIKQIEVPPGSEAPFLLQAGDVLLCEGNSAELVGRPALWAGQIPDCVHQNHVLRVRTDRDQLLPEYLLAYMQTVPARSHFRRRAKKTTNLATINSTDVRELAVPLPPLPEQEKLADVWVAVQTQVREAREKVFQEEAKLRRRLEEMISDGMA